MLLTASCSSIFVPLSSLSLYWGESLPQCVHLLTQLEVRLVHKLSTAYCTQSELSLSPPNLQIWNNSSSEVHIVQCSPLMCNFYKRTSPVHPSHSSPLGLLTETAQNAPQEGTSPGQRLRNFKKGLPQILSRTCASREQSS